MSSDDAITVLVVDDDFAVAEVHRAFVESVAGFVVVGLAHTGAQTLQAVAEHHPDLVLLDIHLPDISGLEVLRRLRARADGEQIDVLAITAAREVDTVRAAMAGGVSDYLIKPFPLRVFVERLEAYAAQRMAIGRLVARQPTVNDQVEVDRMMFGQRRVGADHAIPKGLSRHTLDLVADVVRAADGDMSAREVGAVCGLSRVSARRYLEQLAAMGLAQVTPRYGTAGRPENGYRWMDVAQ